ncbi:carbohydrate ABC transporter permease [Shouchella lonarensis]|uniref:Carbohydrate ABC transporter membrane protein 2, CUT1 family n=1 Tax=Shouchella lonarensis TaxID=1464122 RepID=A0A1G6GIS0_9BACI|nr:carbohydrate ABC transporter permease [Shouchella lonarensis]SDB81908.1 carbohydrate ABC transporter membrane protein 2, CUT1 family [Shouchella lonarensis]
MNTSIGKKVLGYSALLLGAVIIMFPIVYALLISFMEAGEVMRGNLWPESFSFANYIAAFERVDLFGYLLNSFLVSFIIMIGQLTLSSLAAYAFVFLKFKGRDFLFYLFISTMLIPWEATMVANFQTVQFFGWIDNYAGLTVPFFALAFGTFLLRQQFKTIPTELHEAAQVAGISRFSFFIKVVLPISKTSMITLGIYTFLTAWNMYLWPLLVTNSERFRTVQIGLKQMQSQETGTEWGVIMAGAIMIILPTLLLLFFGQKRLQEGLTRGAIK